MAFGLLLFVIGLLGEAGGFMVNIAAALWHTSVKVPKGYEIAAILGGILAILGFLGDLAALIWAIVRLF